jgi:hypothetical protein
MQKAEQRTGQAEIERTGVALTQPEAPETKELACKRKMVKNFFLGGGSCNTLICRFQSGQDR